MALNGLALILLTVLLSSAMFLSAMGFLLGKGSLLKAAAAMAVLGGLAMAAGQVVRGPAYYPIAALVLVAMISVLRYYEGE